MINKQIIVISRPQSATLDTGDIELIEADCLALAEGQVRVRVIYLSIDPTIRLWLNETPPVIARTPLGAVVPSVGIGVIEASRDPQRPKGELVSGMLGWQAYCTCSGKSLQLLPKLKELPLTAHLSLLGATGLTAYFGLLDLGAPKAGDTVLVTGAAGAVGSLVGQIGKIKGCRVIGVAGGQDKCRYLQAQLGFDVALNYRDRQFDTQLASIGGIDVFFDNVGGAIREKGLLAMGDGGRVVVCGEIASGYKDNNGSGIINSFQIITKSLKLLGLRVDRYFDRAAEAFSQLTAWSLAGQIQHPVTLHQGLNNAPTALNALFSGGNTGKTLVQVSPEPN